MTAAAAGLLELLASTGSGVDGGKHDETALHQRSGRARVSTAAGMRFGS